MYDNHKDWFAYTRVGFLQAKTCFCQTWSLNWIKLKKTKILVQCYLLPQDDKISSTSYKTKSITLLCTLNHISCCLQYALFQKVLSLGQSSSGKYAYFCRHPNFLLPQCRIKQKEAPMPKTSWIYLSALTEYRRVTDGHRQTQGHS